MDKENLYLGETGIKIYEKIKNWGKIAHPVGALIPLKEEDEWMKLRDRFEKYGVNMNKGGLMFVIRWANLLMDASCPTAEKLGYHPVEFTDDQIMICAKLLKGLDTNRWVKKNTVLKKEILDETNSQLKISLGKEIAD